MRIGAVGEGLSDYTWSFPICPFRVSIGLSVVEGLQQDMAAAAERCQGVLFGRIQAGVTQIDAWQPVDSLDRESLAAAKPVGDREAVGYYSIREGNAFMLSPAEVEVASSMFNRQGAVMLLVERRKRGAAEATFYFSRAGTFVHNLPLPFPFHAGILSGAAPRNESEIASISPPPVPRAGSRRGFRAALIAVVAICAVGLAATYFRDGLPTLRRSASLSAGAPEWISTTPKQDLELVWDPKVAILSSATAGVLKIEDGGVIRQMSLDAGDLLLGGMLYAPVSDRIRVELTALQRDGRMVRTVVTARPAQTAAAPPLPGPVSGAGGKGTLLADALRKADELAGKRRDADRVAPARPPLKRFVLTEARPVANAPAPSDAASHELPAVTPPVVTATLPAGAVPVPDAPVEPPPAPPKPTPAPAPVARPAIPRSGRLIWTGTLPRRGIVELDGRNSSVGSLNGSLPGAPVNLTITPAEFVDDGLVVYTTDAARNNRVEQPSAGNGWNKVKYVYDPERATQIAVLEWPNESNGFVRLALRSDARRCSMILIDWTLSTPSRSSTAPMTP